MIDKILNKINNDINEIKIIDYKEESVASDTNF